MGIKSFIIEHVTKHPADIVNLTMRHFKITRPAVHKHLQVLLREGRITARGKTRARIYALTGTESSEDIFGFTEPLHAGLEEGRLWTERAQARLNRLPANVLAVCEYGFTEMANNAIDHSGGMTLAVGCDLTAAEVKMAISDDGVGIFAKLKAAFGLDSLREAVLHLTKGKFTTDPSRHSGQGIFFTSRAFDRAEIAANGLRFIRFGEEDWFLLDAEDFPGTRVTLSIAKDSRTELADVFGRYAPKENDYGFTKTRVVVELGLLPGETYVSRSQAKRVLLGLERFEEVVLDFKRVETVGQGFVDEVFRVFQNEHPLIRIEHANANENVGFMIKRGLG